MLADLGVLAPPAGTVVADVGSGPGRLALQVATRFPDLRVAGVDRSPEMVAESRRAAGRRSDIGDRLVFHEADVAALPFADDAVGVVVSTLSLHHWPDVPGGLAEIARVLPPHGQAMIYDPLFSIREATVAAQNLGLHTSTQSLGWGFARLIVRGRP